MGAWGTGLYSSDMTADMRATIKSVLRLPLDEDGIVDVLRNCEGRTADDPNDEDYTTFWLVLADQFEKRGVAHTPTRAKATPIIDRGEDLAMMVRRGMKDADLRKRGAKLAELRALPHQRCQSHARPSSPPSLTCWRSAFFMLVLSAAPISTQWAAKRTAMAPLGTRGVAAVRDSQSRARS